MMTTVDDRWPERTRPVDLEELIERSKQRKAELDEGGLESWQVRMALKISMLENADYDRSLRGF